MISRRRLIGTAVLAIALCSTAGSSGEVVQKEGVRVQVAGKLTPEKLPRSGKAPVSVSIAGRIGSTGSESSPPQLRRIEIDINSHGRLSVNGIPRCRMGQIMPSTTSEALAACRQALVGEGSFSADVKLPEQSPFPSKGKVVAFNGRFKGKPAILAHVYGTKPAPTSVVLPFIITRMRGTYGTRLEAELPQVTGEWGFVTGIAMELQRRFVRGGVPHSYLSAGCPAPAGFSTALYPLARTIFTFETVSLSAVLRRQCKVGGTR
jgi:hypothetical protein